MTKIILRGLTESCKMIRVNNQMSDVYLKDAVIDSKGSMDKNTLRTGTLSWEDVENKADYKAGGMGISYAPKDSTTISGGQYWGEKIVDSRREYVKYLLNGGYESINDIEFRKRLNQYHSAEN